MYRKGAQKEHHERTDIVGQRPNWAVCRFSLHMQRYRFRIACGQRPAQVREVWPFGWAVDRRSTRIKREPPKRRWKVPSENSSKSQHWALLAIGDKSESLIYALNYQFPLRNLCVKRVQHKVRVSELAQGTVNLLSPEPSETYAAELKVQFFKFSKLIWNLSYVIERYKDMQNPNFHGKKREHWRSYGVL